MSRFDDLEESWGEEGSALISLDMEQSIIATRGVVGTGDWYRDPCDCPNDDCPGKDGGNFKVISLLFEDIQGNEYTVLIPAETQFAEVLLDHETIQALKDNLQA